MPDSPISVVWCAPAGVAVSIVVVSGADMQIRLVGPRSLNGTEADVVVLDTRCFPTLEELLDAAATVGAPAVVCCRPEEAEAALARLPEGDDVCLTSSPAALVLHRVRQLSSRHRASRDDLTGLVTRKALIGAMQRQTAASTARQPVSMLLLDIDWFKMINDEYGHTTGDRVLKELGARLTALVPTGGVGARVGGEEFALLMPGGRSEANAMAEAALRAIREDAFGDIEVTVSIGIGTVAQPEPVIPLFRQADEAMYAAKARGRDRSVHYGDLQREALETDRDVALESFENRTRVIAEQVAEVITRRGRRLFQELKAQADVDGLTKLFTRRYFDRRLPFEFQAAVEEGHPLTVALIDLDDFGEINKTYGWPTGDKVLTNVADRIRRTVRGSDWVARYGGEEICVVLYRTGLAASLRVLERIRTAISGTPFETTDGQPVTVTASLGVAERQPNEDRLDALIERVSERLLAAKRAGKNRVVA